jgi:hypothetical protein
MSIVKIADTPPAKKPVPVFGSATDLAHGLIREWIDENLPLRSKCDKALVFIYDVLASPPVERNRLEKYLFNYRLKRHRHHLTTMVSELRYIATEIEDLVGTASYLKAGLKSKIKNKKQFDDAIVEYKEITIMLLGLTQFLKYNVSFESNFQYEISLLDQVRSECMKFRGFYESLYERVGRFEFK